jgi:hypothetical protein
MTGCERMPLRKGFRVNRSRLSSLCAVLLAVLFLSTPVLASERRAFRLEGPGLFSAFWDLLASFAVPLGSGMDPNGAPRKAGSGMDPNGAPACRSESGSIMDPNGCPGSRSELGSIMDPDGRD